MTSTNTLTLADVEKAFQVSHLEHLDREAAVPVVNGLAAQGDVAIVPAVQLAAASTKIPATGYPVVRGENGGNTHALFGPGFYDAESNVPDGELRLGTLTVPAGEQVLLSHPEHGGLLIEAGTYEMRRQREQADVVRIVAD